MSSVAGLLVQMDATVLAVFGESVSYFGQGMAAAVTLTVVWSEGKAVEDAMPGIAALAFLPLSSFAISPQKDDRIIRGGKVYQVAANPIDYYDRSGGVHLPLRYAQQAP